MAPFGSRTLTTRPPASCCANRARQPSAKQRQTADGRPTISPRLKEQKRIAISLDFLCGCDAAIYPVYVRPAARAPASFGGDLESRATSSISHTTGGIPVLVRSVDLSTG